MFYWFVSSSLSFISIWSIAEFISLVLTDSFHFHSSKNCTFCAFTISFTSLRSDHFAFLVSLEWTQTNEILCKIYLIIDGKLHRKKEKKKITWILFKTTETCVLTRNWSSHFWQHIFFFLEFFFLFAHVDYLFLFQLSQKYDEAKIAFPLSGSLPFSLGTFSSPNYLLKFFIWNYNWMIIAQFRWQISYFWGKCMNGARPIGDVRCVSRSFRRMCIVHYCQ